MVLKVLDVDGAVRRVKGGWVGTGQPWEYDEPRYRKLDEARRREQQAMLDYQSPPTAAGWRSFARQLDDPELVDGERCGRCDNCTGARYRRRGRCTAAEDTRARLMRPGVELTPRKQWPSGLAKLGVDLSGRLPTARARTRHRQADGLGLGRPVATVLDAPDGEASDDVVAAAVKVLASWDWESRPTAVMAWTRMRHRC